MIHALAKLGALLLTLLGLLPAPAQAGQLTRALLEARFAPPLVVGERDPRLPVWPVFGRDAAGKPVLQAHVFETVDLEPVLGYAAKPINLLVTIDPGGALLDVELLNHNEPLFRSERGTATLAEFAAQYRGLTAQHRVQVLSPKAQRSQSADSAILHGVLAGTVTTTAIDRSILESALQVLQARLDQPVDPGPLPAEQRGAAASGPNDRYERMSFGQLAQAGLLQQMRIANAEVQARFRGTAVAGQDAEGILTPRSAAVDLWLAPIGLPHAGRNLLARADWDRVRALREAGTMTLLVLDGGRYRIGGSVPAAAPAPGRVARLSIEQNGQTIALHEIDLHAGLLLSGQRSGVAAGAVARLFAAAPGAGPDLGQPMTISLRFVRSGGAGDAAPVVADFPQPFQLADAAAWRPVAEAPAWHAAWEARRGDLLLIGAGLALLTLMLWRQRWLSANRRRLGLWRVAYLVFTLVFVGWIAQGQLTIVSLTSLIESLRAGTGASFLLADPMAVLLWTFVGASLLVWGRGTFCGWLCPFGALQELVSLVTRRLGLRARHLRLRLDAAFKRIKYVVLATIVGAATTSAAWTERLVEVEPFKTSISLHFQREWPYVAWALGCIALSVFVYRGYCRYICPLGAALALLGRVRLFAWIPRRSECGTPCQSCRHRCEYQAIAPSGKVDYDECFQCLDCVGIHQDEQRCLPLIVERKARARVIAIRPLPQLTP